MAGREKHYKYAGVAILHDGRDTRADYTNNPLETDAVSLEKAASNIKFQIRRKANTWKACPISLDLDCLYCIDDIEAEMWRAAKLSDSTCPDCGAILTDGGYCPHCDDGYELITV